MKTGFYASETLHYYQRYHDVRKVSKEDLNILFLKITQQKTFDVPTSAPVKTGTYFSVKPACFPLYQDNFYRWLRRMWNCDCLDFRSGDSPNKFNQKQIILKTFQLEYVMTRYTWVISDARQTILDTFWGLFSSIISVSTGIVSNWYIKVKKKEIY